MQGQVLRTLGTLYDHLENLARQLLPDDHMLHAMLFEVRGVKVMITGNVMQHCEVPTTMEDSVEKYHMHQRFA